MQAMRVLCKQMERHTQTESGHLEVADGPRGLQQAALFSFVFYFFFYFSIFLTPRGSGSECKTAE